jgi:hypothetical protein
MSGFESEMKSATTPTPLALFDETNDRLATLIETLGEKLEPVLRPPGPEPANRESADHYNRLNTLIAYYILLVERVRDLTLRVDL